MNCFECGYITEKKGKVCPKCKKPIACGRCNNTKYCLVFKKYGEVYTPSECIRLTGKMRFELGIR